MNDEDLSGQEINELKNQNTLLRNELDIRDLINQETHIDMDVEKVLAQIADMTIELIGINVFNYALLDELGLMHFVDISTTKAAKGLLKSRKNGEYFSNLRKNWTAEYKTSDAWVCISARENREIYYPELDESNSSEYVRRQGMKACYILPITYNQETFGSIIFANYDKTMYLSEFEKELIRGRVKTIGKVLENAKLYKKINGQKELLEEQKKIIDQDLMLASLIQKNLIPKKCPVSHSLSIASRYLPMLQVGGDYFDFFIPDEEGLGILITDASGHGVGAAFITSMLKMVFDSELLKTNGMYPDRVLKILNTALTDKTAGNFVTALYAYFDIKNHTMKVSCCGHTPLYLIRQNKITDIHPRGRILGLMDDIEPDLFEMKLLPQDRFFFYTDGLTEAKNSDNIEFEEKLKNIIINNGKKNPEELNSIILSELSAFTGIVSGHYEDDVAIITVDYSDKEMDPYLFISSS